MHLGSARRGERRALARDGAGIEDVAFAEDGDLSPVVETMPVGRQLGAYRPVGVGDVLLRSVDQVDEESAALDMPEKAVADAGPLVSTRDQAGISARTHSSSPRRTTPRWGWRVVKG